GGGTDEHLGSRAAGPASGVAVNPAAGQLGVSGLGVRCGRRSTALEIPGTRARLAARPDRLAGRRRAAPPRVAGTAATDGIRPRRRARRSAPAAGPVARTVARA